MLNAREHNRDLRIANAISCFITPRVQSTRSEAVRMAAATVCLSTTSRIPAMCAAILITRGCRTLARCVSACSGRLCVIHFSSPLCLQHFGQTT